MTFKRMMVLGAMASALAFTGCQDRSRDMQDVGTSGAGDQSQPATGGSGRTDTIPGSTDTIGGTPQDSQGTDLGGTGAQGGTLDNDGTGGSGSLDHSGSGDAVHDTEPSDSLDQRGTGGSSLEDEQSGNRLPDDQNIRQ